MIGRDNREPLISIPETVATVRSYGTAETLRWVKEFIKEWQKHMTETEAQDVQWANARLCSALFDAGRIEGIKEERAARRARQ